MKCPACNRQLEEMNVGGLVVDVCKNGCGGIWFDNFELEKVDEQHETEGELLLDIPRDETIEIDYSRTRLCPKCKNVKMMKHFVSPEKQVEIDECGSCGGIWLDCGELARIRSQYATEKERREAARAYFSELFGGELEKMHQKSKTKLKQAEKFARVFRFICPSYYIPGKQDWGAF